MTAITERRSALIGALAAAFVLSLCGCSARGERASPLGSLSAAQAEALYLERCATCHNSSVPRTPDIAALLALSAEGKECLA